MALKRKNYVVKSKNLLLPEAYAYIIECHTDRKNGYAIVGVFANREDATNERIEPHEKKRIDFAVIRTENAFMTAYVEAKKPIMGQTLNIETKSFEETVIDARFSDWEDDIV